MQIAGSEGFTSRIDCIQKKNYHHSSNYFYPYKNNHDLYPTVKPIRYYTNTITILTNNNMILYYNTINILKT
jgi:hypothetical protein